MCGSRAYAERACRALDADQLNAYLGDRDDPALDSTRKLVKRIDFVIERQELPKVKPGSNCDARAVQRVAIFG
jgi:hypothetical protein